MKAAVWFVLSVSCQEVPASTCDLTVLLDVSHGYDSWKHPLAEGIAALAGRPGLRVALATYTDKPTAYLGFRAGFGGWQDIADDYCYKQQVSLTRNVHSIKEQMIALEGSGGADHQEAQFEALLRAVNEPLFQFPFVPPSATRLLLLITDDAPHVQGDLQASLRRWSQDYGNEHFCRSGLIAERFIPQCLEAGRLSVLIDEGIAGSVETTRWTELQFILGPRFQPFPLPNPVHSVTGNDGCLDFEYPDWRKVRNLIQASNIKPFFFVTSQRGVPAWGWFAEQFDPQAPSILIDSKSNITQLILDAFDFYGVCR
eukprot:Gregarina_sp_Poly_1__10341@NODE_735_length_6554_cov_122_722984_g550_i0_p2_GENE_NODE_735_length_6554_cov_122_722984_g550_i0NODE_735_length_6554_cov_122_722984_g550_i0_p2_ORF_typecomplete_len313_score36_03Integrin_beta/PF00362_18/3_5e13Integrin_beta/PF00362_18/7_9e05VWA/PF00092_28/0_0065_NODE_735_length_6554_cov_122_722984_g550_i055426480